MQASTEGHIAVQLNGTAAGYGSYGYPAYGYPSYYNTVTPGYGYGGVYRPGYRAARRVAIHRARWH